MDLNLAPAVSLSQADPVSAASLQYLNDLAVKSELRKISESRTASVEDIVKLSAAAQAALAAGLTAD